MTYSKERYMKNNPVDRGVAMMSYITSGLLVWSTCSNKHTCITLDWQVAPGSRIWRMYAPVAKERIMAMSSTN